jgi:hypothetical protein
MATGRLVRWLWLWLFTSFCLCAVMIVKKLENHTCPGNRFLETRHVWTQGHYRPQADQHGEENAGNPVSECFLGEEAW